MSKRRITQETFDAAVKENMEEFEMDPDEALREAVEQFESQGKCHRNHNIPMLIRAGGSELEYLLYGGGAKQVMIYINFKGVSE